MRQTILHCPGIQVLNKYGFAEIRQNILTKQHSLHATTPFNKGKILCLFSAMQVYTEPNPLTVQTGIRSHITLLPEFLKYTNHSCEPNIFFNTTSMELIALKRIDKNEELCFFYPSTEWELAQPFYCYCGSIECLQNVKGAKYLLPAQIKKYAFTDFIKHELQHTNL